jgi:hypothetical protein
VVVHREVHASAKLGGQTPEHHRVGLDPGPEVAGIGLLVEPADPPLGSGSWKASARR